MAQQACDVFKDESELKELLEMARMNAANDWEENYEGCSMMLIYGYLVIEDRMVQEHVPKFSLKPGDYVSEQVRKEFDDWLAKTFGYNPYFIISEEKKMIFLHPNNVYLLKHSLNMEIFSLPQAPD